MVSEWIGRNNGSILNWFVFLWKNVNRGKMEHCFAKSFSNSVTIWFQMNRAPIHFYMEVSKVFKYSKIDGLEWSLNGYQNWVLLDSTPHDLVLWEYVKSIIYDIPPITPSSLKARIREIFRNIHPKMLVNIADVFKQTEVILNICYLLYIIVSLSSCLVLR